LTLPAQLPVTILDIQWGSHGMYSQDLKKILLSIKGFDNKYIRNTKELLD